MSVTRRIVTGVHRAQRSVRDTIIELVWALQLLAIGFLGGALSAILWGWGR